MYTKQIIIQESLIKPPISQNLKSGCVMLKQGECVGEHCTDKKEEILLIIKGIATVVIDKEITKLSKNMIGFIPKGKIHNVWNKSEEILQYIYIVTPV